MRFLPSPIVDGCRLWHEFNRGWSTVLIQMGKWVLEHTPGFPDKLWMWCKYCDYYIDLHRFYIDAMMWIFVHKIRKEK